MPAGVRQATEVDSRSLDDIYAAAQKESGPLIVAAGDDGMYIPYPSTK